MTNKYEDSHWDIEDEDDGLIDQPDASMPPGAVEEIPIHTAHPQPLPSKAPPACRHRNGTEACEPECMTLFGSMYKERLTDTSDGLFARIKRNHASELDKLQDEDDTCAYCGGIRSEHTADGCLCKEDMVGRESKYGACDCTEFQ